MSLVANKNLSIYSVVITVIVSGMSVPITSYVYFYSMNMVVVHNRNCLFFVKILIEHSHKHYVRETTEVNLEVV